MCEPEVLQLKLGGNLEANRERGVVLCASVRALSVPGCNDTHTPQECGLEVLNEEV